MSRIAASNYLKRICLVCYSIKSYDQRDLIKHQAILVPRTLYRVHINTSQGPILISVLAVLGEPVSPYELAMT